MQQRKHQATEKPKQAVKPAKINTKATKQAHAAPKESPLEKIYAIGHSIVMGLVAIALIGFLFNKAMLQYEGSQFTAPGTFIEVDAGYKLNMICKGPLETGYPFTVILETSQLTPCFVWSDVMDQLSAEGYRVCTYDRAGKGFSGSNPRKPVNYSEPIQMVNDLESLLSCSGEKAPYLMVGHQLGALVSTAYALRNKDKVKELLLLDPLTPSLYSRDENNDISPYMRRNLRLAFAGSFAATTGLARLLLEIPQLRERLPLPMALLQSRESKYVLNQASHWDTVAEEFATGETMYELVQELAAESTNPLGNTKITIVNAGQNSEELATMSVNVQHVVDSRSDFAILDVIKYIK